MEHTEPTVATAERSVAETEEIIRRRIAASDWSPSRIAADIHSSVTVLRVPAEFTDTVSATAPTPIFDQLAEEWISARLLYPAAAVAAS